MATRRALERETVTAATARRGRRACRGHRRPPAGRRARSPSSPRRRCDRPGASATVPAARPAAGRVGSPPSSKAGTGPRSRPAGCASPWTSTTSCRPSTPIRPPVDRRPTERLPRSRLARARSVASSLDLRGARVDEALEALSRYLDDAALAGLTIGHDHPRPRAPARCAMRCAPRRPSHPLVSAVRAGERGEGGDGATIVSL